MVDLPPLKTYPNSSPEQKQANLVRAWLAEVAGCDVDLRYYESTNGKDCWEFKLDDLPDKNEQQLITKLNFS